MAGHSGLVRKSITVRKKGKTFRQQRWVRSEGAPGGPAKHGMVRRAATGLAKIAAGAALVYGAHKLHQHVKSEGGVSNAAHRAVQALNNAPTRLRLMNTKFKAAPVKAHSGFESWGGQGQHVAAPAPHVAAVDHSADNPLGHGSSLTGRLSSLLSGTRQRAGEMLQAHRNKSTSGFHTALTSAHPETGDRAHRADAPRGRPHKIHGESSGRGGSHGTRIV